VTAGLSPDPDPWRSAWPYGHSSWVPLAESGEYRCKICGERFSEDEMLDMRDEGTNPQSFGRR